MLLYIVEGGRQLGHGLVEADVLENLWRKINSYIKYSYTPTTARKQTVNFPLELFLHPVFFCDKSFSSWSVLNRNHTSVNFFGSGCAHNCFFGGTTMLNRLSNRAQGWFEVGSRSWQYRVNLARPIQNKPGPVFPIRQLVSKNYLIDRNNA